MANLQKTLDSLQPYVIGIRYLEGQTVVDAVFKEGWTVPESEIIKKIKGNDELNYYMIFSERDGIGLDELLDYVDTTIKANIEREKKHELLKEKVNELKEIFKKTSLVKLKNLKFTFNDEELIPDLNDFNLEEPEKPEEKINEPISMEKPLETQTYFEEEKYEEGQTDEDREILEEEARAEAFRKMQEHKKLNGQMKKISQNVELPPKKIVHETDVDVMDAPCECGPHEACRKCIETKDL
jgi:hypothetical protein